MNFSTTEEQNQIQLTAQKLASTDLRERLRLSGGDLDIESLKCNISLLSKLGFVGMNIPNKYGGSEVGSVALSLAISEIAAECVASALTLSVNNLVAETIYTVGNENQRQKYLPLLCQGTYLAGSFCLTESGAGSDPSMIQTKAVKTERGWIISGTKQWITSALIADLFVVWAVTDRNASRGKGITCFIVEASSDGVSVGPAQKKMGQTGSPTSDVYFSDVFVPDEQVLGQINDGYRIAVRELTGGRIGIASLAIGIASAALSFSTKYATQREQFGSKISDFQGIQWLIADRFTELEAARLLTTKAAWLKEQNQNYSLAASMAKLYASETANQACTSAIQITGGYGYMTDFPLERHYRDAKVLTIYEGTSEIQRMIIAKDLIAKFKV